MRSHKPRRRWLRWIPGLVLVVLAVALAVQIFWIGRLDVQVYSSLDVELAEPLLGDVTALTRLRIDARYEGPTSPPFHLAQLIAAAAGHPRCDVFWSAEPLQTLRLAREGLFAPYESPAAAELPAQYRAPEHEWQTVALRARVFLVNSRQAERARWPRSLRDLTDATWRGKCAIARPEFATDIAHAACLITLWGLEPTRKFFRQLKQNEVRILPDSKAVAQAVSRGEVVFGLTDSNLAVMERNVQMWLELVYPDQGEGNPGTLFLPTTLAIVKDCPRPSGAQRLVDQLLTARAGTLLANGPGALAPVHPQAKPRRVRVESPPTIRPMAVDFSVALDNLETAQQLVREEFPQ